MEEFNSIAALFASRARELKKQVLFIHEGRDISYAEADERSGRIAHWLENQGLKQGDIVASFMRNSIEHALIWLACTKLGVVFAATNTALMPQDLAYTLGDLDARLIFVQPALAQTLDAAADIAGAKAPRECCVVDVVESGSPATVAFANVLHSWADIVATPSKEYAINLRASTPAGILYTGGSTGMPKGVLLPNGWYTAGAKRFGEFLEPEAGTVHMGLGQMFHANGTAIDILGPIYNRMTTVISGGFSATRFWDHVRETDARSALMVGPMISILVSKPPSARDRDHSLRRIIGGTGQISLAIRQEFESRFGVDIVETYAQTESGPLIVGERPYDKPYLSNGCGRDWTDIRIVDDNDDPLPPNKLGQICIRPRQPNTCMLGYHNKPEVTVAVWKDLWFHTGDLGFLDEHGRLHFKGRHAHVIRRKGENISAFEVEQTITSFPGVEDVAVVGVPSPLGEEDVKAYVQLKAEAVGTDPVDIVRHCEARLAKYKVPRYFEYVQSFPRSSAKQEIERHVLRARGIGECWDRERQPTNLLQSAE